MTTAEQAGKMIMEYISGKSILEIACGRADFSLMAAEYASKVECVDLDGFRLSPDISKHMNIRFQPMDATRLAFADGEFSAVIAYNAIAHLSGIIAQIVGEGMRVTSATGVMIVISSWGLDKPVINESLIPFLIGRGYDYSVEEAGKLSCVIIRKCNNSANHIDADNTRDRA